MPYNNPYDLITKSRQIHRLCHFTHVSNLSNILKNGIFSSRSIPRDQWNDSDRVDGYIDYVCTSVELPNSYCLKNMVRKTQTNIEEWIIFKINPYIIDDTSLFCPLRISLCYSSFSISSGEGGQSYLSKFENQANIEIRQSTDLFDSEKTLKWLNCGRVPYDFPINFNDYRE